MAAEKLITEHLDLWTTAIKRRSTAGRGTSSKVELYGIKKLRELILELAVRGLLVPQDPNDEPASKLLKRIAAEKAKLVKEGKIKKDKPLPPANDAEMPFELPKGWLWERLPNISFFQEGPGIMAKDFRGEGVPLIRISGMHGPVVSLDGCNFLDEDMVAKKWSHFRLEEADIILSSSASLGKVSKVGHDAIGSIAYTGLIRFKPFKSVFDEYLIRFLGSSEFVRQIDGSKRGAAILHFGPTHLRGMIVPVPPLVEQHRIVAKVDELMALCDQLEQQTDASLSVHQTLVETLLNALTSAADHTEFTGAWQRIAEHFDTLFTTEQSIGQLKQTLLELAVRGLLVPQDPNDEPASKLLKRIAAEKAKLVKEGKIKKDKPLPAITLEDVQLEPLAGWVLVRLGLIINIISGQHLGPAEYFESPRPGSIPYLTGPAEFGTKTPNPTRYTNERRAVSTAGDILLTVKGSGVGKTNIACQPEMAISRQLMALRPIAIDRNFISIVMETLAEKFQAQSIGIAIPGISREDVLEAALYLPPLAEQYRIVAKVDELMALCDQLKSRVSDAQTTQLHLADALTEKALARA